jgi:hypothetical protein
MGKTLFEQATDRLARNIAQIVRFIGLAILAIFWIALTATLLIYLTKLVGD